jgi:hypothetical protein
VLTRENSKSLITQTIQEYYELIMIPLRKNISEYNRRNNSAAYRMNDQFLIFSMIIRNMENVAVSIMDLDNINLSKLLNLCKDISELYNLPVYKNMPENTVIPTEGIKIELGMNSKDFVEFILGYEISEKLRNTKFVTTSLPDIGVSLPWNTIVLSNMPDRSQGRYNPRGNLSYSSTEVGRIGLEIHELWHQVRWKEHPLKSFGKLTIIERIKDLMSGDKYDKSPYYEGDTVENSNVISRINKLEDITAFEGQAQFIGRWAADVFAYYTNYYFQPGDKEENKKKSKEMWEKMVKRLTQEAWIILRSGFNSKAANEIIQQYQNLG